MALGPVSIQTARLWLRLLRPGATTAYHRAAAALVADGRDLARMLTFPKDFTHAQACQRVKLAQEWWAADTGWSYGIWQGPHLIGQAQIVTHGSRQRVAEVAYWISQQARGRGYSVEAIEAVIQRAQAHWPLERVEATVVPGNQASIRVLENLGFEARGQEVVPYDLPTQLPLGLQRVYLRRGRAPLLIFARSLTHQGHER